MSDSSPRDAQRTAGPPSGGAVAPAPSAESADPQPADGASRHPHARLGGALAAIALIALAALGLAAWEWYGSRHELALLRQEVARRLAELDTEAKRSRIVAEQARDALGEIQVKLGVLENKLAESQSQQIALEALYQELSRNRDEWTFAEIEQSLLIANQQLQLAGNIKAALIALQNADTRLQRMENPKLTALRKALSADIEKLKALPYVDTVGISVRLDNLIEAVDKLPLAMDMRPLPGASPARGDGSAAAWVRFLREVWNEVRQLVRIQHMDRPEPPLLAPSQAFFLRENLKLRLLGARLALLARDEKSYRADLKAAQEWLERYYDTDNASVRQALAGLRNLQASDIRVEVPDISATLDALRRLRPTRGRAER